MTPHRQARSTAHKLLQNALLVFLAAHLLALVLLRGHFDVLNFFIGLSPLLAVACILWRTQQIERWQRTAWYWITFGLLLWSAAQMSMLPAAHLSNGATPTFTNYLFFLSALPVLLGVSSTPATRNIPSVRVLNAIQALLAVGLAYVRMFYMPVNTAPGSIGLFYDGEFILLGCTVTLRYLSATVPEDSRTIQAAWLYCLLSMPTQAATNYIASLWHIRVGTPLDLVYTLPFLFLGWRALSMPIGNTDTETSLNVARWRIFLQSLCPMFFTCGVFALGISVAGAHLILASLVMLTALLLHGLHSSILNTRFVLDRERLRQQEQQLLRVNAQLSELSLIDHLTGISNRRHLAQVFDREWERASRQHEWLSLLMIDADYFKGVNDRHGHTYGDQCLRILAQLLSTSNRGMDFSARYGGEEFFMLLPNTTSAGAQVVAQRIHNALREQNLPNDASPERRLTISIGIASIQVQRNMHSGALLHAADQALYEAKQSGRNQTRIAEPEAMLTAAAPVQQTDLFPPAPSA